MTEVKLITDKDFWDYLTAISNMAIPLITLGFGVVVLRITKRLEQSQWRSQKVIEKRIEEWDSIRQELNDIFCYCVRVGDWKSMDPLEIIDKKRIVDRKMHLARPYFSKDFFRAYVTFIKVCFAQYQGHGVDAKIKSPIREHQNSFEGDWDSKWNVLFYEEYESEGALWDAYQVLQGNVAEELETLHD